MLCQSHIWTCILADINTCRVQWHKISLVFIYSITQKTLTSIHTYFQLWWCPVCCMCLGVCPLEWTICSFLFIASIPSCALSFWWSSTPMPKQTPIRELCIRLFTSLWHSLCHIQLEFALLFSAPLNTLKTSEHREIPAKGKGSMPFKCLTLWDFLWHTLVQTTVLTRYSLTSSTILLYVH